MPGILSAGLSLVDATLGLLFSTSCVACGELSPGKSLCPRCVSFRLIEGLMCDTCGEPRAQQLSQCGRCWGRKRSLKIRSTLWLGEAEKTILHKIKYSGRFELMGLFRECFEASAQRFFEDRPAVSAIPLHPGRFRERGFNQAEILARWVSRRFELSLTQGLVKRRATAAQSTLSRAGRLSNLRGSFSWNGGDLPESVLLVDDVLTTGATLTAAASALRRAGVKRLYAWTLFRVPEAAFLPLSSSRIGSS